MVCPTGSSSPTAQQASPPEVAVVEAEPQEVPLPLLYAGRVAGFRDVEVRAQVSGILLSREYEEGTDTTLHISRVLAAMPTVSAFQRFRIRAQDLNEIELRALASLRAAEGAWQVVPFDRISLEGRRTIWREALLAWKDRIESRTPALLMERNEFEDKVRALAEVEVEIQRLNRELLASVPDPNRIKARREWEDVYMLQGQRARRLREIVELGEPLGLFRLRPVWLCSPEMVSRVFALKPDRIAGSRCGL